MRYSGIVVAVLILAGGCGRPAATTGAKEEPVRGEIGSAREPSVLWTRIIFDAQSINAHIESPLGGYVDCTCEEASRSGRAQLFQALCLGQCFLSDQSYRWGSPEVYLPLPMETISADQLHSDLLFAFALLDVQPGGARMRHAEQPASPKQALQRCVEDFLLFYGKKYDYRSDLPHELGLNPEERLRFGQMFLVAADCYRDGSDHEAACVMFAWGIVNVESTIYAPIQPSADISRKLAELKVQLDQRLKRLEPNRPIFRHLLRGKVFFSSLVRPEPSQQYVE